MNGRSHNDNGLRLKVYDRLGQCHPDFRSDACQSDCPHDLRNYDYL